MFFDIYNFDNKEDCLKNVTKQRNYKSEFSMFLL